MSRIFEVDTVGGSYEMDSEDIDFLKNEIQDFENLVLVTYKRQVPFGHGYVSEETPFKLELYSGKLPKGMLELVNSFNKEQQGVFYQYFTLKAGKICFQGTKEYYTHKKWIDFLHEKAKIISTKKTSIELANIFIDIGSEVYEDFKFLPFQHICYDILEQLKIED